ncbi:MAG: hypothetical protein LC687_01100 [Actinobacteria bacterium]|nr:hypothetical protein [Actinomycetota bacterium]
MNTAEIMVLLSILRESVKTANQIKDLLESQDLTEDQRMEVRRHVRQANAAWEQASK